MVQISSFHEFKICFKERLVQEGSCKLWFELPFNGICTSRLDIPISKGGLMPSCKGKADGIHHFDYPSGLGMDYGDYFYIGWVCDVYFKCRGGNITIVKCNNGIVFHMDSNTFKPGNSSLPNNCTVTLKRRLLILFLLMLRNVHILYSFRRQQGDAKTLIK